MNECNFFSPRSTETVLFYVSTNPCQTPLPRPRSVGDEEQKATEGQSISLAREDFSSVSTDREPVTVCTEQTTNNTHQIRRTGLSVPHLNGQMTALVASRRKFNRSYIA